MFMKVINRRIMSSTRQPSIRYRRSVIYRSGGEIRGGPGLAILILGDLQLK